MQEKKKNRDGPFDQEHRGKSAVSPQHSGARRLMPCRQKLERSRLDSCHTAGEHRVSAVSQPGAASQVEEKGREGDEDEKGGGGRQI